MSDFDTIRTDTLSSAGVDRRDRMLGDLVGEMRRVHRGRRVRRRVVIIGMPLILVAAITSSRWLASGSALREGEQIARQPSQNPGSRSDPAIGSDSESPVGLRVILVHTSPDVTERYRAACVPQTRRLNDDELLETLAAMDRPAGLIRAGEHVWLTRPVTDEARENGV